jgi:hypothetical protein
MRPFFSERAYFFHMEKNIVPEIRANFGNNYFSYSVNVTNGHDYLKGV